MSRIETRTISLQSRTTRRSQTSVGTGAVNSHKAHAARSERERHEYTYTGGITRCSRCPLKATPTSPDRFCADCARINNARQHAGLIRPAGDLRPSADNIINPTVVGKYRGPTIQRRYKNVSQPVVTAFIEKLGGGWRRGIATLNGVRVYEGKPTRSQDDAWGYATRTAGYIKEGLRYESDLADRAL